MSSRDVVRRADGLPEDGHEESDVRETGEALFADDPGLDRKGVGNGSEEQREESGEAA